MINEREFDSNTSQNAFNEEIPKINTTSNNSITMNNDQSSLIEIAQSNENELSEPDDDDDDDELERLRSEALNAKRTKNLNFAQSKIELRKSKHFI